MTYPQIAEWVDLNFDIATYGDPKELWLDVEQRFWQDGMYLPPEAEEHVAEYWEAQVGSHRREPAIIADFLQQPQYIEPEIMQIQEEFYATLPEPGEALETREEGPVVQPRRAWVSRTFGSLGRKFARFFGLGK